MKNLLNRITVISCFLLLGILFIKPVNVFAETPKVVNLPCGKDKNFRQYDITGDGVKDNIQVYSDYLNDPADDGNEDYTGIVAVNGKVALTFTINEEYDFYNAQLIVLKNGAKFLYLVDDVSEDIGTHTIYKYSKGSFHKIIALEGSHGCPKYGYPLHFVQFKVSNNTLKAYATLYSYTLGKINTRFEYVYSKGTLKKSPTTGWINKITQKKKGKLISSRTLEVNKSLTAYKSSTSNKKAFGLKKGNKVSVDRIYFSSKYGMRVRVKYKKKYGWIKGSTSKKNGYFKYIYNYYD